MKVLVKAVAAGAIGCAALLPATAAHAQAPGDALPDGVLPPLDTALSSVGLGGGLFSGNQAGTAAPAVERVVTPATAVAARVVAPEPRSPQPASPHCRSPARRAPPWRRSACCWSPPVRVR